MEILLRRYGDEYYAWKEAIYKQGRFYIDGISIYQIEILSIRNDDRKNFVECSKCGEVIHNDPESIEAHFAVQEAKRDCLNCNSLRISNKDIITTQYEKDDFGNYIVTEKSAIVLACGESYWNRPKIDSAEAKNICKFMACRRAGVREISDIFTEYPNLFDKQATVDTLNEKNSTYEGYQNGFFVFDLKCHDAVKAYVNFLGIIDHFTISFRSHIMRAFYSARYDKLLFDDCHEYVENAPYDISDNRYNQAKAKISALYKEA